LYSASPRRLSLWAGRSLPPRCYLKSVPSRSGPLCFLRPYLHPKPFARDRQQHLSLSQLFLRCTWWWAGCRMSGQYRPTRHSGRRDTDILGRLVLRNRLKPPRHERDAVKIITDAIPKRIFALSPIRVKANATFAGAKEACLARRLMSGFQRRRGGRRYAASSRAHTAAAAQLPEMVPRPLMPVSSQLRAVAGHVDSPRLLLTGDRRMSQSPVAV
jgi:hypothetical protein